MRHAMFSLISLFATVLFLAPGTARASDSDDASIKVRFLLQPWVQSVQDAAPSGDAFGSEFFVRRARVILAGKVNNWIHFFYETDNPNFGKNGKWDSEFFTQDAYVDFRFYDELKVAVGLLLLPFTHHNRQGATTLNTLDYHNIYSSHFIADKVWRDTGVEARGIVGGKLDYRVGLYNGRRHEALDDREGGVVLNPDDMPRIAGRLAFNLFDAEDGFFYGGNYLGKKKIVTLGVGFDGQPDAVLDSQGNHAMYSAFSGDLFVDYPINDKMELIAQTAFVYFDRGYADSRSEDGESRVLAEDPGTGMGAFGELGFRYDKYQPVVSGEWFSADAGAEYTNLRFGLNYWLAGHNANVKLEYGLLDATNDGKSAVTLQTQLLF